MAKFFDKDNQLVDTNNDQAQLLYDFKELLKTAGWTHVASGDGDSNFSVTPGNVNDVITNGLAGGANSFNNTRAWWIGQQPAGGSAPYSGTRQILIQMGDSLASGNNQRWAYSYSDGFSGGSPDANTPPDFGADVQFLAGGGTPASPSFTSDVIKQQADVYQLMASDFDDDDKIGFYIATYDNGGTNTVSCFVFNPIIKFSEDGVNQDEDPYVFSRLGSISDSSTLRGFSTHFSWMGKGSGGTEAWQEVTAQPLITASGTSLMEFGPDHITGGYSHPFITFGRDSTLSAPGGWKGESTIMGHETGARAFRDTFDSNNGDLWVRWGLIILPWDSTTEPIS